MNGRPPEIPPHKLISTLRLYNLLPAIVFQPTRRKCDESASEVAADKSRQHDPEKFAKRQAMFDEFGQENPEVYAHKHAKILVNAGVAAHHAGHMPSWKLLVEQMMSAGLLNAIFATSTVAAGVDFPARTVVISNADARGNEGWRALTANELQQMTGRAGRRGKDNVGFVVLVPGQFQKRRVIAELLRSKPDALESKFRSTYTSLLNLLDAFGSFQRVREIAERSFAFRHQKRKGDIWRPFDNRAKVLDHFGYLDYKNETVTESGKWLADLRIDRPLLVGEALKQCIFDELTLPNAAGLIASVASHADRSYGLMHASRKMDTILSGCENLVVSVSNAEWKL